MRPALSTASPCGERLTAPSAALACACVLRKCAVNFTSPLAGSRDRTTAQKIAGRSCRCAAPTRSPARSWPRPTSLALHSEAQLGRLALHDFHRTADVLLCLATAMGDGVLGAYREDQFLLLLLRLPWLEVAGNHKTGLLASDFTIHLEVLHLGGDFVESAAWASAGGLPGQTNPAQALRRLFRFFLLRLFIVSLPFLFKNQFPARMRALLIIHSSWVGRGSVP